MNIICGLKDDERISSLFKVIDIAFGKRLRDACQCMDLTASQSKIIAYIYSNQNERELNPIHIEQQFSISRPTTTGILKRLEAKGFIEVIPSSKDKRYKQLKTTSKGESHFLQVKKTLEDTEAQMLKGIASEDIEKVRQVVKCMIDNVS